MGYEVGNVGVGPGYGGCGNKVGGAFTSPGAILVLFILLVIIICSCMY
ncbi:hypothetical protein [Paenibacillus sp. FSL H8-0537]